MAIGAKKCRFIGIGNNNYKNHQPLRGTAKGMKAVAEILEHRYGFSINPEAVLIDACFEEMMQALNTLATLEAFDILVLYYAGHGYTDPRQGRSYWLPVDAGNDSRTKERWIDTEDIVSSLFLIIPAKHILVLSDSCFTGDFVSEHDLEESRSYGYEVLAAKCRSREILTSGMDTPTSDAGLGGLSPFTYNLLDALKNNSQEWIDPIGLYEYVKHEVKGPSPQYGQLFSAGHEKGGACILMQVAETSYVGDLTSSTDNISDRVVTPEINEPISEEESYNREEATNMNDKSQSKSRHHETISKKMQVLLWSFISFSILVLLYAYLSSNHTLPMLTMFFGIGISIILLFRVRKYAFFFFIFLVLVLACFTTQLYLPNTMVFAVSATREISLGWLYPALKDIKTMNAQGSWESAILALDQLELRIAGVKATSAITTFTSEMDTERAIAIEASSTAVIKLMNEYSKQGLNSKALDYGFEKLEEYENIFKKVPANTLGSLREALYQISSSESYLTELRGKILNLAGTGDYRGAIDMVHSLLNEQNGGLITTSSVFTENLQKLLTETLEPELFEQLLQPTKTLVASGQYELALSKANELNQQIINKAIPVKILYSDKLLTYIKQDIKQPYNAQRKIWRDGNVLYYWNDTKKAEIALASLQEKDKVNQMVISPDNIRVALLRNESCEVVNLDGTNRMVIQNGDVSLINGWADSDTVRLKYHSSGLNYSGSERIYTLNIFNSPTSIK